MNPIVRCDTGLFMVSRFIKQAAGWFAGLGLVVFALLLVLSYVVRTDQFKISAETWVNSQIPGSISCDSFDLSLFRGAVEADNIAIRDPEEGRVITARRMVLNLSWLSLLRKTVHLDKVILDEPDVYLETDIEGNLNLLRAFSSEPPSETEEEGPFELPVDLTFGSFRMNRGNLHYKDIGAPKEPDEEILVRDISLDSSKGNINRRSGRFRLELGPCRIQMEYMDSRIKKLVVESSLKKDMLSPFSLHLDSDMGRCDLSGAIGNLWENPQFALDVDLDVDLAGIDRVFDVECELKGRVTGGGTFRGRWDDPDIDARLFCKGGSVLGAVVGDLDLDTKLSGRKFDVRKLFVRAPAGTATITGFVYFDKAYTDGFFTSDFIEPEFAYDLKSDVTLNRPYLLPGMPDTLVGNVKSRLSLKGKGFYPESMETEASVSATAGNFRFLEGQEPDGYRLNASGDLIHSRLNLKRCEVEDSRTFATVKGLYNTAKDTWNADATVRSDDLSRSTLIKPYGPFAGRLNLETSLSGNLAVVSGRIAGQGKGLSWDGVEMGDVRMAGFLKPSGIFTVDTASVTHPKARIRATGDIGVLDGKNAMDLDVSFIDFQPSHVLKDDRLKGVLDGRLRLKGTVEDPVGSLILGARKLAWETWPVGNVRAEADYAKGLVTVHDLELLNGESKVDLKGTAMVLNPKTWEVFDDPVCDVSVQSDKLRIEDFYPEMKGQVSFSGHIRGPATRPYGRLEFTGHALDLAEQTVAGVKGQVRFEGEDLFIDHLVADVRNGETVEAAGRVSLVNETYDMTLKSRGVSLKHIDALAGQDVVSGTISADLEGQGRFDDPAFRGKVRATQVVLNGEPFDDADLDVLLDHKTFSLSGKALAEVEARVQVETYDFSASAEFEALVLDPFLRMAEATGLQGKMSGEVHAVGNLENLDGIKAEALVTDLLMNNGDVTLVTNKRLEASYEDKRFLIHDSRFALLDKGDILVGGRGTKDGDLDLYLKGTIPLSVADLFSEDLSGIDGDVLVDGRVGGTFEKPDILATMTIRDASFMIPELMQSIHEVNGEVRVDSKSVTIERLRGKLDSGTFRINGSLALDDFKPGYLSLAMAGDALPISLPDMMDMTLNTRITVKGTPDDAMIEGNLLILNGKYYKDVSLDLINVVKINSRSEAPQATHFTEPYLKSMGLNLSLTHRSPFEVDNNVAFLPLKPNLRILGTLNNPLVSGRAEVDVNESFITYQGKVFDVTRGRVDFLNPYVIEPTLDVQCKTEIRDWIIYLLISGTPENLKFSLTSNPVEEDADILSLLVLGKTTEEILEGNGDKTQSAAKLLAGILSSSIEKNIKDATGIDTVEVEYITSTNSTENGDGTTDETIENGVKVTLGKELSERLTLKYGVETKGGVTIHQAVSEYRFFENMLMNAYQDTENKYGAELVYRIEFR